MLGGISEFSLAIVCPPCPAGQRTDITKLRQFKSRTLAERTRITSIFLNDHPPFSPTCAVIKSTGISTPAYAEVETTNHRLAFGSAHRRKFPRIFSMSSK